MPLIVGIVLVLVASVLILVLVLAGEVLVLVLVLEATVLETSLPVIMVIFCTVGSYLITAKHNSKFRVCRFPQYRCKIPRRVIHKYHQKTKIVTNTTYMYYIFYLHSYNIQKLKVLIIISIYNMQPIYQKYANIRLTHSTWTDHFSVD